MNELRNTLNKRLERRVFNHEKLTEEIIKDFKESEEFKQLIIQNVSELKKSWWNRSLPDWLSVTFWIMYVGGGICMFYFR